MVIAYFPVPYQDELLYSVIARYAVHTARDNQKAVIREILSDSSATAIPDLPSHIDLLVSRIRQVYLTTAENVIFYHTLAPIYLPFLHPKNADLVIASMRSKSGGSIHTRAGISASMVKQPIFFRYCPLCVKQQIDSLGEPYWCRLHQIPGVNVCSLHECKLMESRIDYHAKHKHLFTAAIEAVQTGCVNFIENIEIEIAIRFKELLTSELHCEQITYAQWSKFYHRVAEQNNLISNGRINHFEIQEAFKSAWLNTALKKYVDVLGTENSWLKNIFRKHRKSFNPLQHLMVWVVFVPELSIETILSLVRQLPREFSEPKNETHHSANKPEAYSIRFRWLALKKKYPGDGIKKLRMTDDGGAIYAWLYRNDRQWLLDHKPSRKRPKSTTKVNYEKWDEALVKMLEKIKADALKISDRPRLSTSYLIKSLPRHSSIEKHLDKLIKTRQWLEVESESIEDFQITRIYRVAK